MEWRRVISAAPAGALPSSAENRWFASPANIQCPSGTNLPEALFRASVTVIRYSIAVAAALYRRARRVESSIRRPDIAGRLQRV